MKININNLCKKFLAFGIEERCKYYSKKHSNQIPTFINDIFNTTSSAHSTNHKPLFEKLCKKNTPKSPSNKPILFERDISVQQRQNELPKKIKEQLLEGTLNQNPLPFENTIVKIRQAQSEIQTSHSYQVKRFLRNLSDKEKDLVTKFVSKEDHRIEEIAEAINASKNPFDIMQDSSWSKEWAQLAFAAFEKKLITRDQLTSLLMLWATKLQFEGEVSTYQIFTDTEISESAKEILLPALDGLSKKEVHQFCSEMKKAPESEQGFAVLYMAKKSNKKNDNGSFFDVIDQVFPLFRFIDYPGVDDLKYEAMVIPSITLFKAYLKAVFKENAVGIEPEFGGASSIENIELDLLQHRRPLATPFPGLKSNMVTADSFYVGLYGALFHDFYHIYRNSIIPKGDRLGIFRHIEILRHSLSLSNQYPEKPLLSINQWKSNSHANNPLVGGILQYRSWRNEEVKVRNEINELLDMELPSIKYEKIWIEKRTWALKRGIEPQKQLTRFASLYSSDDLIDKNEPDIMRYYACLIHDMVIHKNKWAKYFQLDVSEKNSRWKCTNLSISKLYEGFRVRNR